MPTNVYIDNGLSLLLNGEVGADYAFSVEGITNGAGRVSAQIDLGPAPRPYVYQWSCEVQFQATPTKGKGLDLSYATAPDDDATQIDGDIGAVDAALTSSDDVNGLIYFDSVNSRTGVASEKCVESGEISITTRYLSIAAIDNSGASVDATDTNFRFNIQPKVSQGQ